MSIQREFLGVQRPALSSAAEFLLRRYTAGGTADLSPAIVVLPGGRAGRRLLEILVDAADARSLLLTPPQIVTVGRLPEKLYHPKKPFAPDLVQQLAWADVLRRSPAAFLRPVIAHPPEPSDGFAWLELGQLLARLHTELAADRLDFAAVAKQGATLEAFAERHRWEALAQVQTAYLALLDSLDLWDVQTARLEAIKRRECATDRDIFLIGAVDMPITLRHMLDQIAARVTALIVAPLEWADRFDEHGCLVPPAWESVHIPIDEDRVHVVDDSGEQADRVARCLAAYGGKYRPDEITIGLADERIAPQVQRQLQQCRLTGHTAAGVPLPRTGPYRLLAAVAAFLQADRYAEFAALVRHPDLYAWIERQTPGAGWLEQLDAYHNTHLQSRLGGRWLGTRAEHAAVSRVYRRVQEWLLPLQSAARPLSAWGPPLRALLLAVYAERQWDRTLPAERVYVGAFEKIDAALAEQAQRIPAALLPAMTGAEALRLTLGQLQGDTVALPMGPAAIELLGWLELPLDDAPALVVCSFNEGCVPSSVNSDMFLPNALRSRLNLQDNARRYARDACALSVLLATRETVDLIVGRRNADNDPLPPSRLLFAADAETIARRAWRFFRPPPPRNQLRPLAGRVTAPLPQPDFPIPRPEPLAAPLEELAITAFRDYLACPFRFYLRRVLRLGAVDDAAVELDGGAFGSLLHAALRDFGAGPRRDATDPGAIATVLLEALDRHVAALFGERPLAAVAIQVEQLRLRLRAFAAKQAEWAAQGWRIEHAEVPDQTHPAATFVVDGRPIVLRGRIDRIDVRSASGERVILDYKSSDAAQSPEKTHQRGGEWVDLQLPLYRHLVRSLGIAGPVRLGYILLPKDTAQVEFCLAEWTDDDLREADARAQAVVQGIRDGRFWPPADPPPDFSEEFAPLCQDGVFDRGLDASDE